MAVSGEVQQPRASPFALFPAVAPLPVLPPGTAPRAERAPREPSQSGRWQDRRSTAQAPSTLTPLRKETKARSLPTQSASEGPGRPAFARVMRSSSIAQESLLSYRQPLQSGYRGVTGGIEVLRAAILNSDSPQTMLPLPVPGVVPKRETRVLVLSAAP